MASSIPTIKLNSGYDMPQVGFGLWKVNNDTCADTVYNAIKTGYRLFDGACGKFNLVPDTGASLTNSQTTETRSKPARASPAPSRRAW